MAAPYILHQPERTNCLFTPGDPWQNARQTQAQATLTPNTSLRTTLQDLTDVARDLPTEEALPFYDIGRRLSEASKEQNKRVDLHDTCYTLETRWNEHHLYQHLLWRSREFAGEAQGAVDGMTYYSRYPTTLVYLVLIDFRELVLPSLRDQDRTRGEKQEIIREQIQVLQDTSQPSQKLCQEFLDFGRALDLYIVQFSQVVEGLKINEQTTRVSELQGRLRSAKDAMEVKELGWKFAADVAVAGIALLLALVVPTLWAKLAVAAVIQFLEARRRCDCTFLYLYARHRITHLVVDQVAVTEYEAIKAEYDLERACLGQMVKLESTLHDSRPLVQEVTMKLGIFASVWAAITADIRKLKNSLHRAGDPTSQVKTLDL
ncbi:hypothetical protein J3R83DRAFT_1469 [Lanmaoa asiatica]|nr:hypothetical protein J3R83DRAFT_1469 [Lanmaoa asiatica]